MRTDTAVTKRSIIERFSIFCVHTFCSNSSTELY